jgi:hypothetical protein
MVLESIAIKKIMSSEIGQLKKREIVDEMLALPTF